MAISATDAPVYTDLGGLTALKRGAAHKDPDAIRKVAQQFESLFTRMMLKSMRDAVGPDPMFGSDQQQMYQSMFDDQLSLQLSHGRGLGLADMLIRQLQRIGVPGAAEAGASSGAGSATPKGAAAYLSTQRLGPGQTPAGSALPAVSDEAQASFVRDLWPQAQQAGEQLGVDPRNLIAQAALETHWGRNLPQSADGHSSNNLFGVKASARWSGPTVTAPTQEFQGGLPADTTAQFRSYANPAQSFQDYVALLRNNPRYAGALNTGADVHAFAAGLQRGGYATDPDYVRKIGAIARNIDGSLARSPAGTPTTKPDVTDLKSAAPLPITADTGAL